MLSKTGELVKRKWKIWRGKKEKEKKKLKKKNRLPNMLFF